MKKFLCFFADNSLSIVLTLLFIIFLVGQALSGRASNNDVRAAHGLAAISYGAYLRTGAFLNGIFSNWQAAILQLGSLIIFGVRLHQKGAPHSKKSGPEGDAETDSREKRAKDDPTKGRSWLYRNSLFVAFLLLFLGVFVLHLWSGTAANNVQRAYTHQSALSIGAYFRSSTFWFSTLQTWEAEYMAIALYVLLSIVLRQQGSPESKPVEDADAETGEPND